MNRRYVLYLMLVPLAYVLYVISKNYSSESPFFYGFAENKETELSHYSDSYIETILVSEGEAVVKGQPLMLISRRELPYKANELELDQSANATETVIEAKALRTEMSLLESQKENYVASIEAKILAMQEEGRRRQSQLEALASVSVEEVALTPAQQTKIAELRQEKIGFLERYSMKYDLLNQKLEEIATNQQIWKQKVTAETKRLEDDVADLQILAPTNGVIGNIPRKQDEYVKAYTTLLTYYEENPTLVKGYVHESLILEVNIGDSLYVASTLRQDNTAMGVVIGLGSRIVEIPERLRKMQTVKTYGREVLVQIPANNSLLQKERVSINTDLENRYQGAVRTSPASNKKKYKELSLKK